MVGDWQLALAGCRLPTEKVLLELPLLRIGAPPQANGGAEICDPESEPRSETVRP
jgi:hypothetical protein